MINKIKNSAFIKSTLILLLGGTLTKILGFILKIIITRKIGTEGIALYSLLSPTMSLLTVLAIFSYPTAISKIISEKNSSPKKLLISIIPISIIINIALIVLVILFAPILSNNLLKEPRLYYPIICVAFTLPFVSISSIIKGYFWGKQNMFPYMLSNFLEQVTRFILISIFIADIASKSLTKAICFILFINIIGEIISQLVMIKYFPKTKINKNDIKINKNEIKNVMQITIPSTSSKIIGSISYFLEPIILTNMLLYFGYSKEYILYEYGVLNAYALSLLLMPQFFTQNMSSALVPELSKYYSQGNKEMCKKRIKQIVLVSFLIGLFSTVIIVSYPNFFLNALFSTTEGIDYIKIIAPFTILFYIEYPLINALQALGEAKKAMYAGIIGSIIRLLSIIVFSALKIGMYTLVLSIITTLIYSTISYYKIIKKVLN
ncbi:MAG: oligosaccharide flippase family protein [Bacilli bacterium]|nr:oligosaccharide flippase family protein [Bacilli bacterium]